MPFCQYCNRPIVFVDFEPKRNGEIPKSIPIDIKPDPQGSIMLYHRPEFWPGSVNDERNRTLARKVYARRCFGQPTIEMYLRQGGAMYKIHFDTCPSRSRQPYKHRRF